MKKIWISITLLAILVAGCRKTEMIGFLSDYSRLEKTSDSSLIYSVGEKPLTGYKNIIVEPVKFDVVDCGLKPQNMNDLRQYLELSTRKAVLSNYNIVDKPSEETAVLKVSLTSVDSASAVMTNPQAKTISGATVEIEIIDSLTNQTLLSMVQSRNDKPVPLSKLSKWAVAKQTIDQWTLSLENTLNRYAQDTQTAALPSEKPEKLTDIQVEKPKQPAEGTTVAQNIQ